jgi:drug/metabolite transporter (DMT)-like permease
MLVAYLQLATSMALVGVNVAVAKLLAGALPVAMIVGLRCLLACVVLWPLARARDGQLHLPPATLANLAAQALLGTLLYNAALLAGLRHTTALEAGLVLATLPAVIALGSALWLRERLAPRQWAAAALAASGMGALTLASGAQGAANGGGSLFGNALVFLAVCGEAAYVLLAKRISGRVPVITASFWMQAFSTLMLLPFCLPVLASAAALGQPMTSGLLVFHSLTASVLCLLLWYQGLLRAPAGVAGVFCALLPASAALVAVLVLGETFRPLHGAGLALMLGSIGLATWPRRRR